MRSAARYVVAVAATVILLGSGTAAAQQAGGWKNELSGGMGFQVSLNNAHAPGGFKMENEYGRRFTELVWLNLQLNFVVGDDCVADINGRYRCSEHFYGDGLEMIAGVKLKFRKGKLQPHAKVGAGLVFSFYPGDYEAVGIVLRAGGGFKYWVLPRLAVGGEANFMIGPTFYTYDHGPTKLLAALDFIGGIEFAF
jgi:hypothetical protein